jgi:galactokinase
VIGHQKLHLERFFRSTFGPAGEVAHVRAPGRVNLIGEHLDYNGLPVMPMSLDRGIGVCFRARTDDRVRLANVDAVHRPIDYSPSEHPDVSGGGWSRLVRAAVRGLYDRYQVVRGFDGVAESDLPIAAGLSSSTALVVAVARALIWVNRLNVHPLELIECLSRAERSVGAPGGCMDQAVCIAGRPRTAVKMNFAPLRLTPIDVPDRWKFVVAHSGVTADKSGSAEQACRTRINECRQILDAFQAAGIPGSESHCGLLSRHDRGELEVFAGRVLSPLLRRRYRHLITESLRVDRAEAMLRAGDLATFGRLMSESHHSLCGDFEVSHPRLDRLVEACVANGAVGARLTGAGFGGSVVALCGGSAGSLIDALSRDFYSSSELRKMRSRLVFLA